MSLFAVYLKGLERHGTAYADAQGRVYLSLPERLRHEERSDTIYHVARSGEYLCDLAAAYYAKYYERPLELVPVLAQFQEYPIVDASLPLEEGQIVEIPSVVWIESEAYGDPLTETPQI